jgi:hypothetical protein
MPIEIEIAQSQTAKVPYYGQPIVPPDSFLRRLPHVVSTQQRLAWDAIVMASDIMTDAFCRIRNEAIARGLDFNCIEELGIAPSIGACWAIVDQLHAVRQLMSFITNSKPPLGPLTQAFMDASENTNEMRNKMDHLRTNMGNLSAMKGPRSPLFGSLSYFHIADSEKETGHSVVLYSGALIGETRVKFANPTERTFVLPVGLFEFSAFGRDLLLETTLCALLDLISAVAPDFENQIENQCRKHALENGLNLDELLTPGRGSFAVAMVIGPPRDAHSELGESN